MHGSQRRLPMPIGAPSCALLPRVTSCAAQREPISEAGQGRGFSSREIPPLAPQTLKVSLARCPESPCRWRVWLQR